MNAIRRGLILIGLTPAVLIGAMSPASATFTNTSAVSHTVSTGTVAAPATVTVDVTYCHPVFVFDMTASWPASTTSRGVIGYRVSLHLNNGTSDVITETDAATRSISVRLDRDYLQFDPTVSVTTLTSYGWTKQSVRSSVLSC
jgi:hypothetical protein